MSLESIELWHKRARNNPTEVQFSVQLGCHFEEITEMCEALSGASQDTARLLNAVEDATRALAEHLKAQQGDMEIQCRSGFLDALADQVVTAIGSGYCARMRTALAINRVNISNWSKFDDRGQPVFNAQGKVAKSDNYTPVALEGLY